MDHHLEGAVWACRPLAGDDRLEDGFTVLELLVVMATIAALMSAAVPTFLSARSTAQDRAAQSDLRTALIAANTVYVDAQSFSNVTVELLETAEPRLHWNGADHTSGPTSLAVAIGALPDSGTPAIGLASDAGDGTCWYTYQADNDAPWYGEGPRGGAGCDAGDAPTLATTRTF